MSTRQPTPPPANRADRFLPAETVQVIHPAGQVNALVPGRRETAFVRWTPQHGWVCSCRATSIGCGHIAAVRQVVVLDPEQEGQQP